MHLNNLKQLNNLRRKEAAYLTFSTYVSVAIQSTSVGQLLPG